jgi:hypothetical protein
VPTTLSMISRPEAVVMDFPVGFPAVWADAVVETKPDAPAITVIASADVMVRSAR